MLLRRIPAIATNISEFFSVDEKIMTALMPHFEGHQWYSNFFFSIPVFDLKPLSQYSLATLKSFSYFSPQFFT